MGYSFFVMLERSEASPSSEGSPPLLGDDYCGRRLTHHIRHSRRRSDFRPYSLDMNEHLF
jgi:hypothetical protein